MFRTVKCTCYHSLSCIGRTSLEARPSWSGLMCDSYFSVEFKTVFCTHEQDMQTVW